MAISALDRASINDKRLFRRIVDLYLEYNNYQILIKYKVLDYNYFISELNSLPSQFDLEISDSPLTVIITLHHYIA